MKSPRACLSVPLPHSSTRFPRWWKSFGEHLKTSGGATAALLSLAVGGMLACAPAGRAQDAAALTTTHLFTPPDAQAGVIQATDGNFYGTTSGGGDFGFGSVYRVTSGGVYTTLHSFHGADGDAPQAALLQASDGNFYGTTYDAGPHGSGTIFRLTPAGVLTTIYSFSALDGDGKNSDGALPRAALIQATDGNLYGTTYGGGPTGGLTIGTGTIFRVTLSGTLTTLYTFKQNSPFNGPGDGFGPIAALVQGTDGNFYGSAVAGGIGDHGTIFQITSSGVFTVLHTFANGGTGNSPEGEGPNSALVQGTDGNFYGTTSRGGHTNDLNGPGTVYKITPAGVFTKLQTLDGSVGGSPQGPLVAGGDGFFYGTTQFGGIFKIAPNGALTVLHTFAASEGTQPLSGLTLANDGNFYGATTQDGSKNQGTVYQFGSASGVTVLHNFDNVSGYRPVTGVILGSDGNLYGTTPNGGDYDYGTVYKTTPEGATVTLYSFNPATGEGIVPQAALVEGTDGNFYGTTSQAGTGGGGSIFQITPDGTLTTIHSFNSDTDGANCQAPLIQDSEDGFFYGTTVGGGASGDGVVFRVSSAGVFGNLHNFVGSDGAGPQAALAEDSGHTFIGTTQLGGTNNKGTIFQITSTGTLTTLHSFGAVDNNNANSDGALPYAPLVRGGGGNYYGTTLNGGTSGQGTVFKIATDGTVTNLHSFTGTGADGAQPYAGLLAGNESTFYGTTYSGGTNGGGTIYRITSAGVLTTLYSLNSGIDGYFPQAPLVQDPTDKTFYGTTTHSRINLDRGTVFNISLAPVINSAENATGTIGQAFSFTVTGTNHPASFTATGLPDGLSINATTGRISGTPSVIGTFTVTVTATNSFGTGTDTLSILIKDLVPVITSSIDPPSRVGSPFVYQITATHNPTSYGASGLPAGLTVNTATGKITGTPAMAGTYSPTITATNSGGTASLTLNLVVKEAIPVINSSLSETGQVGKAFSYQITATSSPTSFGASDLPAGLSVNQTTGKITGTPTKAGTYNVKIAATNTGGSGLATLSLVIKPAVPVITSSLDPSARQGVSFAYQIVATNDPASYGASGLPAGLSVSASRGLISGTPTGFGTFNVTISATNSGGTGTATLHLVTKQAIPVFSDAAAPSGQVGVAYSFQVDASNDPTFSATGTPPGLGLSASTGRISGTPTAAGSYTMKITATNSGGSVSKSYSIVIKDEKPVISGSLDPKGQVGVAFSYQITASNDPVSYAASGLPSGLSVSAATGKITGTPTAAGTYAVTISATNNGGTGSATLNLTIKPAAPVINSDLNPPARQGVAFSYLIAATNSPTSYASKGLPGGLGLSTSTGKISGTPERAGTYSVTISATNAGGTGTATLTIVVKPPA